MVAAFYLRLLCVLPVLCGVVFGVLLFILRKFDAFFLSGRYLDAFRPVQLGVAAGVALGLSLAAWGAFRTCRAYVAARGSHNNGAALEQSHDDAGNDNARHSASGSHDNAHGHYRASNGHSSAGVFFTGSDKLGGKPNDHGATVTDIQSRHGGVAGDDPRSAGGRSSRPGTGDVPSRGAGCGHCAGAVTVPCVVVIAGVQHFGTMSPVLTSSGAEKLLLVLGGDENA